MDDFIQLAAPDDRRIAREIQSAAGVSGGCLDTSPKLLAHPERLARFLVGDGETITPVNLEIWPSLLCNARCADCPFGVNDARRRADRANAATRTASFEVQRQRMTGADEYLMSPELFTRLASEFSAAGGLSVTFTGGGEPTLHPELAGLAALARGAGLFWGLYSNGYGLTPKLTDELLEHEPDFIRISVNRWSPESHHRLYRLGLDAYDRVLENLRHLMARRAGGSTTTVGIGYVLNQLAPDEADGIASFVERACHPADRVARRLDYVAARPALRHYDREGWPIEQQPRREAFAPLPGLLRELVQPACEQHGVALLVNDRGFQAVAAGEPPTSCVSTPWVTSATQTGRLFLLSEANGSPQPELAALCYGDASSSASFAELWDGPTRRKLAREFAEGDRRAPVWHKTAGLHETLKALRGAVGTLDRSTAERVTRAVAATRPKPPHWTFL